MVSFRNSFVDEIAPVNEIGQFMFVFLFMPNFRWRAGDFVRCSLPSVRDRE
jgi:hypothetical protein